MSSILPSELDVACHANIFVPTMDAEGAEEALHVIAGSGFRRVVLPPLDPARTDVDGLRGMLRRTGLRPITIVGQTPDADIGSDDAGIRSRGRAALQAGVELTAELGGDQLNGVPYGVLQHAPSPPSRASVDRIARTLGEVADAAADRGVTMTFEVLNRYETNIVNTAGQALDLVERSGSDNLFIHLDTFHMAIEEDDMHAAVRTALPRLRYLELGQSGRGAFGAGAVDIAGVVRGALDSGYTGRWGIEAFSRSILPEPVADMLAVWRTTFADGVDVTSSARFPIRQGWEASVPGRRARRLSRIDPTPTPTTTSVDTREESETP